MVLRLEGGDLAWTPEPARVNEASLNPILLAAHKQGW